MKLNEEINNIKSIFGSLGYPLEVIEKTINRTTAKLISPTKHGPNKCVVYLRLPYLGKEAKLFENQVLETVDNTFGAVNLKLLIPLENHLTELLKISLLIQKNAI